MLPHTVPSRHPWMRQYARFGLLCMSLLYLGMGFLTALAALGLGGEKADHKGVMPWAGQMPFGRALLGLAAFGLAGYVIWRLLQAWLDPSRLGNKPLGLWFRAGYLVSALFHGGLAWHALRLALREPVTEGGEGPQRLAKVLLEQPHGAVWVWVVAIVIAVLGGVQFWRVFSGRYRSRIKDPSLFRRHELLIEVAGTVGYSARGLVLLVVAWLFWKAGAHYRSAEAGGVKHAMGFLETLPFGSPLLAVLAAGLATYGVFLALQAWGLQEDLAG